MSNTRGAGRTAAGTGAATGRHPAQWLALAIGVVYAIVAIWGFLLTGLNGDFAAPQGEIS